jgi:plastocyanin
VFTIVLWFVDGWTKSDLVGIKVSSVRTRTRKAISKFIPIFVVCAIVIIIAASFYIATMLPGSLPTKTTADPSNIQTTYTTNSSSSSVSYATYNDKNLSYSIVYIVEGAAQGLEIPFSPQNATVVVGTNNTVVWRNLDLVNQTLVGGNGLFNATLAPMQNWNYTFTTPGTYDYSNPAYPWENGTVTVLPQ